MALRTEYAESPHHHTQDLTLNFLQSCRSAHPGRACIVLSTLWAANHHAAGRCKSGCDRAHAETGAAGGDSGAASWQRMLAEAQAGRSSTAPSASRQQQ